MIRKETAHSKEGTIGGKDELIRKRIIVISKHRGGGVRNQ